MMLHQDSQNIRILVILVAILPCMVISNGPVHAQEDMETAEALVSNVFYDSELRQALMDLGAVIKVFKRVAMLVSET